MKTLRCGMTDIAASFNLKGTFWRKDSILWHFSSATNKQIKLGTVAFQFWGKYANINFQQSFENPNIIISFKYKDHLKERDSKRCGFTLDNNELAPESFPPADNSVSEIHINQNKDWNEKLYNISKDKLSLFITIAHEIGHAIGINHSPIHQSLLHSVYHEPTSPFNAEHFELSDDDQLAVASLTALGEQFEDRINRQSLTREFLRLLNNRNKNILDFLERVKQIKSQLEMKINSNNLLSNTREVILIEQNEGNALDVILANVDNELRTKLDLKEPNNLIKATNVISRQYYSEQKIISLQEVHRLSAIRQTTATTQSSPAEFASATSTAQLSRRQLAVSDLNKPVHVKEPPCPPKKLSSDCSEAGAAYRTPAKQRATDVPQPGIEQYNR
ncbi:hypothetical protein FQA39_LY13352 [Lamprigera yunnana]|nr:hypothetical protein FQA39_LY13352 [Lamprigera yunnana]